MKLLSSLIQKLAAYHSISRLNIDGFKIITKLWTNNLKFTHGIFGRKASGKTWTLLGWILLWVIEKSINFTMLPSDRPTTIEHKQTIHKYRVNICLWIALQSWFTFQHKRSQPEIANIMAKQWWNRPDENIISFSRIDLLIVCQSLRVIYVIGEMYSNIKRVKLSNCWS